jgi:hypothetical protein
MIDAMNEGANAVRMVMQRLNGIAHQIATQPVHSVDPIRQPVRQQTGTNNPAPGDLAKPLTELNEVTYAVRAGVVAVEAGNGTFKTLLAIA